VLAPLRSTLARRSDVVVAIEWVSLHGGIQTRQIGGNFRGASEATAVSTISAAYGLNRGRGLGAPLDAFARSLTQLLKRWSRRVVVVPVTEKISIPSVQRL
jgi:hypothetical protein